MTTDGIGGRVGAGDGGLAVQAALAGMWVSARGRWTGAGGGQWLVRRRWDRTRKDLDLVPVILSELPGKGHTIIEKFEGNADVGFAVALLTPDDAGGLSGEAEQSPRARQNVIFELGFFIGKLGRDRVRALTKGEPEIPSDYAGVEYIQIDEAGGWKMILMKELKAAGFHVDANRVIGT